MKLMLDNRISNHNTDSEFCNADINMALSLLASLDGRKHTLLALEREDGWSSNVGGGQDKYVITMTSSGGDNYTLINQLASAASTVELCAGGQFGDYPESIVVDSAAAEDALVKFYSGNEMELAWE